MKTEAVVGVGRKLEGKVAVDIFVIHPPPLEVTRHSNPNCRRSLLTNSRRPVYCPGGGGARPGDNRPYMTVILRVILADKRTRGITSLCLQGKEGSVSRETVKMFQKSWYLAGENLHAPG